MPTTIDRQRVRQLIDEGALLVEVLPPAGYADEHLPGAISIPLKERCLAVRPGRPAG